MQGKTGADLMHISGRYDFDYQHHGQNSEHLFPHALSNKPNGFYDASVNDLTFANPELPKKKLHQYLWAGSKFNDATVGAWGSSICGWSIFPGKAVGAACFLL